MFKKLMFAVVPMLMLSATTFDREGDNTAHNDSDSPRWTPSSAAVTFTPGQLFFPGRNLLKLWPLHHLSMTANGRV